MENENMCPKDSSVDFSKGRYRAMLTWQRKRMWNEKTLEHLAEWMELRHGMSLLDVGCGLGYLGYTFWNYFGKGGSYTGVDIREQLISDAAKTAPEWTSDGDASFMVGSVYELPFDDNSFDWVACQTLMIHLVNPGDALVEMLRVLKPGGMITCIEPDNLRPTLSRAASSLPEMDLEQQLISHKMNVIANRGRIKLGRGDSGIAPTLPHLMAQAGFHKIDIRVRDTVSFLEPPYETEQQREAVENMKKHWVDDESYAKRIDEYHEEYIAGGGDPEEFESILGISDKIRRTQLQQLKDGTFFICSAYPIYIIKGMK